MTTLNEIIQPKRENITSVVAKLRDDVYFVDRSFQRKMIWTESQKIKLIETILMGYPMPEIYLWAQKSDPNSGKQRFSVVDGQQRLSTILQFVSGEWGLKKSALHKSNKDSAYASKNWDSLPANLKQKIWEYNIDVREIPSSLTAELIHKIFTRLNQTDKSLNPQEMRNAEFHGEFIKASVDVANKLNSYDWNIFSDNDMRRMKDVDFSSQLLTFLIQGIVSTPPSALNELYDRYNDKYPERKLHFAKVEKNFSEIEKLFLQRSIEKFFSKPVHFYTIFAVVDLARHASIELTTKKLENFIQIYTTLDFDDPSTDSLFLEYKKGSSYSTTGKPGRERRVYSLLQYVEQN
ncbi:GmrSD restriction endonuclease domain-containing protein [Hellea balneolensis]|uniref:GmrSD restriction endonuclease domain-containing protein n=1 Tax=Hellea balneolensis TaxID=287478 RepID=UPI000423D920|nr:DUF262 domain-containing protein [Hellea balneolensis]